MPQPAQNSNQCCISSKNRCALKPRSLQQLQRVRSLQKWIFFTFLRQWTASFTGRSRFTASLIEPQVLITYKIQSSLPSACYGVIN